jgi:hypothetical protein
MQIKSNTAVIGYTRDKNYLYFVGTREDKQENTVKKTGTWYEHIGQILRQIFL